MQILLNTKNTTTHFILRKDPMMSTLHTNQKRTKLFHTVAVGLMLSTALTISASMAAQSIPSGETVQIGTNGGDGTEDGDGAAGISETRSENFNVDGGTLKIGGDGGRSVLLPGNKKYGGNGGDGTATGTITITDGTVENGGNRPGIGGGAGGNGIITGDITIAGGSFLNTSKGTISSSTITITGGLFENSGIINNASTTSIHLDGGSLFLGGDIDLSSTTFTNGGSATLVIPGDLTTKILPSFNVTGTLTVDAGGTDPGTLSVPGNGIIVGQNNTLDVTEVLLSGKLTLDGGIFKFKTSYGGITPDLSGIVPDVSGGGTLDLGTGATLALRSGVTLTGDLHKTGAGTLDLGSRTVKIGTNTFGMSGGVITNGKLSLEGTSGGGITDYGTLLDSSANGNLSIDADIGLKGTHNNIDVPSIDETLTLTGTITGDSWDTDGFTKTGAGTLILDPVGGSSGIGYKGQTIITGGTLQYKSTPDNGSVFVQPASGMTAGLYINSSDFALPISLDSAMGSTELLSSTSVASDITLMSTNHINSIIIPSGSTATFSGAISGTGTMVLTGGGNLILEPSAGKTLSSTISTVIQSGILQYAGDFATGPSLTIQPSSDVSAELDLSGGTTQFKLPLTLDSSKGLQAILKNTSTTTALTLGGDLTLVGQNNRFIGDIVLAGALKGTGGIIGSLTLQQPPQGTDVISVNEGTISLPAGDVTAPIVLNAGGTVKADSSTTFKNVTFSGGTLDTGTNTLNLDSGATVTAATSTIITNPIKLSGATIFKTVDGSSSLILEGSIDEGTSKGSATITGPGMMSMSGTNNYTGGTTVEGKGLLLTGSLAGDVTVNSGSFIGNGSIGGSLTNRGIVAPVDNDGRVDTLTVGGNYTQMGTLLTSIGEGSDKVFTSSLLSVGGDVTLSQGSTLTLMPARNSTLNPADVSLTGTTLPILQAEGKITGFFSNANLVQMPNGFDFQVVGPKEVDGKQTIQVILHPLDSSTTASSVSLSPTVVNQTTTTISSQISRSQDRLDDFASSVAMQTSGSGGKGGADPVDQAEAFRARTIPVSSTRAGSLFRNTSGQRYQAPQGWDSLFSILDQTGALNLSRDDAASGKIDKTFWVAPLYSNGKNKKTTSSGASSDHMQLLLAGMEWQNPETKQLFGISLGGGFGEAKSSVLRGNKSDHKTIQAALYHSMRWDEVRWDVFANANRMFSHNDRVANASTGYIIKSSNTTDTFGASTEISYKGNLGDLLVVRPYYGLDTWYTVAHGYHEKDNSIYSQAHAKMSGTGFDHYIGASIRKTWMGVGKYSVRLEGDLWYSYILKDSTMTDRITAVENNALIRSTPIAGYGKGTFGPSLTASAMNQETGTKYFISGSATVQDKRTAYQLLLKAAVPLN